MCMHSKYSHSGVASSETPFKLSLFRSEFNIFNNKGAQMLDSIYHMKFNYFVIVFLV